MDAARTMVKREADADDVEAKKEAARKDEVMLKVRDVRCFSLSGVFLPLIASSESRIRLGVRMALSKGCRHTALADGKAIVKC